MKSSRGFWIGYCTGVALSFSVAIANTMLTKVVVSVAIASVGLLLNKVSQRKIEGDD